MTSRTGSTPWRRGAKAWSPRSVSVITAVPMTMLRVSDEGEAASRAAIRKELAQLYVKLTDTENKAHVMACDSL